jgi:iron complex transport system substrate-binding protein
MQYKKLSSFFLSLIVFIVALSPQLSSNAQDDGDGSFPRTIVDATGNEVTIESIEGIVSASGDVSEIIVALGFEDNLVGVDISSTYPSNLLDDIEPIGFARRLAIEPIAAVNPTIVFCTQTCAPTSVLDQVRSLNIPVVVIPDPDNPSLDLPLQKIEMIADALGVPERGAELINRLQVELDWINTSIANVEETPYMMMVYVRGTRLQLLSGEGVPAYTMITNVGAIDAAADIGVVGYTTLNAELILTAYPDYILLMQGGVDSFGGLDEVRKIQGMSQTPAGENDNFIVFDDQFLLGMSTRTGQALIELAAIIHPSMTWEVAVQYPYTITDATNTEITIESNVSVAVTNNQLFDVVQQLGYHPLRLDDVQAASLIIATPSDDWETLRNDDYIVIVVSDDSDVSQIAATLGVPGRGVALLARRAQESE